MMLRVVCYTGKIIKIVRVVRAYFADDGTHSKLSDKLSFMTNCLFDVDSPGCSFKRNL